MKIIDLLNKIANGEELPNKFKYNGDIYEWDITNKDYVSDCKDGYTRYFTNTFFDSCLNVDTLLNWEVEIIEDIPKNIEKIQQLEAISDCDNFTTKNGLEINPYLISATNRNIDKISNKVNEIIDYINKESK